MGNNRNRTARLNAIYLALAGVASVAFLSGCNSGSGSPEVTGEIGMSAKDLDVDINPMGSFSSDKDGTHWFSHQLDLGDSGKPYRVASWSASDSSIEDTTEDILSYTSKYMVSGISYLIGYSVSYWDDYSASSSNNSPDFKKYTVNSFEKVNSSDLTEDVYLSQLKNVSAGLVTWQFEDIKEASEFSLDQVVIELVNCSQSSFDPVVINSDDFGGVDEVEGSGYTYLHLSTLKPQKDVDWEFIESQACQVKFGFTVDGNTVQPILLGSVTSFNPTEWLNITLTIDAFSGDIGFTHDVSLDWPNGSSDIEIDIDTPEQIDPSVPSDVAAQLSSDGMTNRQINLMCANVISGVEVSCQKTDATNITFNYSKLGSTSQCGTASGAAGDASFCVDIENNTALELQSINSDQRKLSNAISVTKGANTTDLDVIDDNFSESDYVNALYVIATDNSKGEKISNGDVIVNWNDTVWDTEVNVDAIAPIHFHDMDTIKYVGSDDVDTIQQPSTIRAKMYYPSQPGAPTGEFMVKPEFTEIDFGLVGTVSDRLMLFKAFF